MPQLVAALHSFVGLAVFIGINSDIMPEGLMVQKKSSAKGNFVGVFIGAITLQGLLWLTASWREFWMANPDLARPKCTKCRSGSGQHYLGYLYMSHAGS